MIQGTFVKNAAAEQTEILERRRRTAVLVDPPPDLDIQTWSADPPVAARPNGP